MRSGGYFLSRLDGHLMTCFDGERRTACRTAAIDWSYSKLSEALQLQMQDAMDEGAGTAGVVAITRGHWIPIAPNVRYLRDGVWVLAEAWVAEKGSSSAGEFVRVRDNGIRCVLAPCPHITEEQLYTRDTTDIDELDFSVSPFRDDQVDRVLAATYKDDGAIVAGKRYVVWGSAHSGLGRTVNAAYLRLGVK
jgi:hypothetical protein